MQMIHRYTLRSVLLFILTACSRDLPVTPVVPLPSVSNLPAIEGKSEYLHTPFLTAGNRVYMIGNQDGSFEDIGWHIKGEMGGIWNHPIKLLDGLSATVRQKATNDTYCLDSAMRFVNYPVGNQHIFDWVAGGLRVTRFQFVPDDLEGLVVQYTLMNKTPERKQLTFCVTAKSDLRPTWLGDSLGIQDGKDDVEYDSRNSTLVFSDRKNQWYSVLGTAGDAVQSETESGCRYRFAPDNGVAGTLCFDVTIEGNGSAIVPVYIAGSFESREAATATLHLLRSNAAKYLSEKISRLEKTTSRSAITIPDKRIAQMYEWLKYNIDWMVREVPAEGVGLSAGLPDYPWWFGADATYSLQGVLATGNHELVKNTIRLLNKISKRTNDDGRIVHEVSTNGVVYNRGNVNETAQFITLVYNYFQWTGDRAFVKEIFPDIKKGVVWLTEKKDADGNGFPNGSGMMEIPGLESEVEMIDVACYTQQALESAATLAVSAGEDALAEQYRQKAAKLKDKIDKQWWLNSSRSFGDFRADATQASSILSAALVRSDTMKKAESVATLKALQQAITREPAKGEASYSIYKNWVVNTPMETGIASTAHALTALETSKKYQNAYGLFVTGIDKSDDPDSIVLASRKKIFSYTGAVMTLPTGVLAVGAARYGQVNLALQLINKLERSFSYALPGSMYEVSPDFGMMTQAWNIYGVAVPLVTGIFGIHPDAPNKSIRLTPTLPDAWENIAIRNVRVGDNMIQLSITRDGNSLVCELQQDDPTWIIELNASTVADIVAGDRRIDSATANGYQQVRGTSIRFRLLPDH